jgi:Spy/CpxP family protein refolding chaperone
VKGIKMIGAKKSVVGLFNSRMRNVLFAPFSLLAILFLLPPTDIVAQQRVPGPPAMEERMERLQQFKKLRLMETLNLNEEESIKFFARYNKFEEELRDLEQQRNSILDDMENLIKHEEKEEAYKKDFDDLLALGQKLVEARTRFYKDARTMLTPVQTAKLLVFERNFNRDLREAIRDVQRDRRRDFYRR